MEREAELLFIWLSGKVKPTFCTAVYKCFWMHFQNQPDCLPGKSSNGSRVRRDVIRVSESTQVGSSSAPAVPGAVSFIQLAPNGSPGPSRTQNPSSAHPQWQCHWIAFIKCSYMPDAPYTWSHFILTVVLPAKRVHFGDENRDLHEVTPLMSVWIPGHWLIRYALIDSCLKNEKKAFDIYHWMINHSLIFLNAKRL